MGPLLHAEGLAIGYGSRPLMTDISIDAGPGELIALLGVNGIGKSTLLRTLAGLHAPLAGGVNIGGRALAGMSSAERARHVSVVLTGRPASGIMDVRMLVSLGRQPWTGRWGGSRAVDHEAVNAALRRTGADHLANRTLSTCSDGECQKVLIARALAQATPVMLLDEPTAFLDLPNRAGIVRMLGSIAREERKVVLFSTHDLQLALDLCDRVLLMRASGPLWQGAPSLAMSSGELEKAFAGAGIRFDRESGTHRFSP